MRHDFSFPMNADRIGMVWNNSLSPTMNLDETRVETWGVGRNKHCGDKRRVWYGEGCSCNFHRVPGLIWMNSIPKGGGGGLGLFPFFYIWLSKVIRLFCCSKYVSTTQNHETFLWTEFKHTHFLFSHEFSRIWCRLNWKFGFLTYTFYLLRKFPLKT